MTDTEDPAALQTLRERLDRIDRELVERASERQRIVSEIGRLKQAGGRQLRDFRREREVLDGVRRHARDSGLDPDVAERLLTTLIEASLTRQEGERVALAARGAGQRALVIGGAGRMGQWLAGFLADQGFDTFIADPSARADGRRRFGDWRAAPLDVDVIVVAAPITASRVLLDDLAGLGVPGLVFDVASIKAPLADRLRAAAAAGLQVCSVHPMFGPDTRLLAGRHVLVADCGNAAAAARARSLFGDTMATLVDVDLDEHDRLMAWVLGLSHALNVAFAAALAASGADAGRLASISSTTFQRQLDIATDVGGENPALYFEIQNLNPYETGVLQALSDVTDRLRVAVEAGDRDAFVELMRRGAVWTRAHGAARGFREPPADTDSTPDPNA
jgi:chorismate mutase/prephenate dehydrogenase